MQSSDLAFAWACDAFFYPLISLVFLEQVRIMYHGSQ